ncbi:MAG: hypothetical protein RLZ72_481 [Actinomycetota bacterium]|jgi:hypothetical protein
MSERERGSASLEFIVVALGVLVPVLAVTVSVSAIQAAQFAMAETARQGVRAFVLAPSDAAGRRAIRRIAALTIADFGLHGTTRFTVACSATPCRTQGGIVRVTTTLNVSLAMIPALPGLERLTTVPITATASQRAPLPVIP